MKQTCSVLCTVLLLGAMIPHVAYGQTCAATAGVARAPVATDDATQGYAVKDLWQACGHVWRAASVRPHAARWEPVFSSGLPADAFGQHTLLREGPCAWSLGTRATRWVLP